MSIDRTFLNQFLKNQWKTVGRQKNMKYSFQVDFWSDDLKNQMLSQMFLLKTDTGCSI